MWIAIVSTGDAIVGRMALGTLNLSTSHPVVLFAILTLMLVLVCTLWVELMRARLDVLRTTRGMRSTKASVTR